jgi:hypothetical protein
MPEGAVEAQSSLGSGDRQSQSRAQEEKSSNPKDQGRATDPRTTCSAIWITLNVFPWPTFVFTDRHAAGDEGFHEFETLQLGSV